MSDNCDLFRRPVPMTAPGDVSGVSGAGDVAALRAEVERLRHYVDAMPGLLNAAWEDGNCVGLDGWIGEDRGEPVDPEAVAAKERHIRRALAALDVPDSRDAEPARETQPTNEAGA